MKKLPFEGECIPKWLNGFPHEREIVDISSMIKSLTFDRKLDVYQHISSIYLMF
jgi:hypothetical protein